MGPKSVELEVVHYRTDEMVHASRKLIHNFVTYSGIEGTNMWGEVLYTVADFIKQQLPHECVWRAEGLDVRFSGFQSPIPIVREEKVVYAAREPHFVIYERPDSDLRPTRRTHINRVTTAIAREMEDVYHMQAGGSPLVLSFPKREYAKSVEVFNAALVASPRLVPGDGEYPIPPRVDRG